MPQRRRQAGGAGRLYPGTTLCGALRARIGEKRESVFSHASFLKQKINTAEKPVKACFFHIADKRMNMCLRKGHVGTTGRMCRRWDGSRAVAPKGAPVFLQGLLRGKMRNAWKGGFYTDTVYMGSPQPKQRQFFNAKRRFVAYGGARGGGKSWAVQRLAISMALWYAGINILIVRRTFPELRENHILGMMGLLQKKSGIRYDSDARAFHFENGSRIRFGYCDTEMDVLQYQGQSIDVVFIDEATQLTEFQFNAFKACVRGANDFPKRIYLTCNPGGVGHDWVKRLFIDRQFHENENPDDYEFIQSTVYDNRELLKKDPFYLNNLKSQPENIRKAWLDGDWNVFEGKYFIEFDPNVHVIEPFKIPKHWRVYRAIDYGLDMLACYWIAVDDAQNGYVFREVYKPGLTIYNAAREIITHTDEPITATLAPPDLWNRRQETGKSAADWFVRYGIPMVKTSNNREAGWMAVHEWLRTFEGEDGISCARLKIFRTCANLIRTLPQLRHDEKRVNDVAREPHELTHGPDALRGFCVYWTMGAQGETKEEPMKEYSDFLAYGV